MNGIKVNFLTNIPRNLPSVTDVVGPPSVDVDRVTGCGTKGARDPLMDTPRPTPPDTSTNSGILFQVIRVPVLLWTF